jgi:hypothetical protein
MHYTLPYCYMRPPRAPNHTEVLRLALSLLSASCVCISTAQSILFHLIPFRRRLYHLKKLRHIFDKMRRYKDQPVSLPSQSYLTSLPSKLTKVQHNSTRSCPLDIRDCLRFGDFEILLGGLGWCCGGNMLDVV